MTESWEEKTERMEREYQARIDRLRAELREARDIAGVVAANVREIGDGAMAQLKSDNAALTKRVAELEDALSKERDVSNIDLQVQREEHDATIAALQSQLAWTPVSAGLPTEPGDYLFAVRGSVTHAALVSATWFTPDGETFEPRGHYRRIELPKEGES